MAADTFEFTPRFSIFSFRITSSRAHACSARLTTPGFSTDLGQPVSLQINFLKGGLLNSPGKPRGLTSFKAVAGHKPRISPMDDTN